MLLCSCCQMTWKAWWMKMLIASFIVDYLHVIFAHAMHYHQHTMIYFWYHYCTSCHQWSMLNPAQSLFILTKYLQCQYLKTFALQCRLVQNRQNTPKYDNTNNCKWFFWYTACIHDLPPCMFHFCGSNCFVWCGNCV